jgi:hypothetical protein
VATLTLTTAELRKDGRTLRLVFESASSVSSYGCFDWLPGKILDKRLWLSVGNRTIRFLGFSLESNVEAQTGLSWDEGTMTLTGDWANYRAWVSGDTISIGPGESGTTAGMYAIASRTSDTAIVLSTSPGATATNPTSYKMPPEQGTKFRLIAEYFLAENEVIAHNAAAFTISGNAGLLQDDSGNSTAAFSEVAVTNNSLCDTDGFSGASVFTSGTAGAKTVWVVPGHGGASDSNTVAQAATPSTAFATLRGAIAALELDSGDDRGDCIKIQQGTTQTFTASELTVLGGASRTKPFLIEAAWDSGLGVGTEGTRPTINMDTYNWNFYSGAHVVVRGLDIVGGTGNNSINNFTLYENWNFDDCILDGLKLNYQGLAFPSSTGWHFDHWFHRCIFKDNYASAAHAQALFGSKEKGLGSLVTDCCFVDTGRKSSDFGATDTQSHASYTAEGHSNTFRNCIVIRTGGNGMKNDAEVRMCDMVFREAPIGGEVRGTGRRIHVEAGVGLGTGTITNATYTHATRELALAGIDTSMAANESIHVASGTGVTVGEYFVASVASGVLTLQGAGLGAGADGSTNISGYRHTEARGYGPVMSAYNSHQTQTGSFLEHFTVAHMGGVTGENPRLAWMAFSGVLARRTKFFKLRNGVGRKAGRIYDDGGTTSRPTTTSITRMIVDNTGQSRLCLTHASDQGGDWSHLDCDENTYLSDSANLMRINATDRTLAAHAAITGQDANSLSSASLTYPDDTADIGDWYDSIAGSGGVAGLKAALVARGMGVWGDQYSAAKCIEYMHTQYQPSGARTFNGNTGLEFEGVAGTDPATYGTSGAVTNYFINTASGSIILTTGG